MIAIAPTDLSWFDFLKNELNFDEVNFWTPTPWNPRRLSKGDRFYFMLKSPYRKIGGYGKFKYYKNLDVREAWSRFGKANGVNNFYQLLERCQKYQKKNSNKIIDENPVIGCIVLTELIFFEEEDFFEPEYFDFSFSNNIVKLKYFEVDFPLNGYDTIENFSNFDLIKETKSNYIINKIKYRTNQSSFRKNVLQAYDNKCAITGESCLEVLDAAHIQPYISNESNHIQNGIILRTDLHRLFDLGLLSIDHEYRVLISPFLISKEYLHLNRKLISVPKNPALHPSLSAIKRHNEFIFRKALNNLDI